jgi:hypothetical protein
MPSTRVGNVPDPLAIGGAFAIVLRWLQVVRESVFGSKSLRHRLQIGTMQLRSRGLENDSEAPRS